MKEKDLDEKVLNEVRTVLCCFFMDHNVEASDGKRMMQKVADDLINFVKELEKQGG